MSSILFSCFIRINTYNLIISLLSISTILNLLPQHSLAQEASYCFMKNAEGRLIDLSVMCGVHPSVPISKIAVPSQTQENYPLQITQEQLKDFAYIYAHQYCDWRKADSRSRDESEESAANKLSDTIIQLYGIDKANQVLERLDVNFFETTDRLTQQICPKDE